MPAQPCTLKKAVHLQATVCAKFGLPCIIYMGAKDMERQALNVFRMRLLGAEVSPGFNDGTAPVVPREGCSDAHAHFCGAVLVFLIDCSCACNRAAPWTSQKPSSCKPQEPWQVCT